MKKYMSILFVFTLFITLLGFNFNSASAQVVPGDITALQPGCTSTVGYSPVNGMRCNIPVQIDTSLPVGCTSMQGYSPTTGIKCDSVSTTINPPISILPPGCTSTLGYSPTTGLPCSPSTSNNTPVISAVSGPQSLNVNQRGTWKVKASSPNGGSLSYSVAWGDEDYVTGVGSRDHLFKTQQSATFTHTYTRAGNYAPTFTVTSENTIRCITTPCPGNGGSATTSLGVNVRNTSTTFPPGCTSDQGFSSTTGEPCGNGIIPVTSSIDSQNPGAGLALASGVSLSYRHLSDVNEDHAGSWDQFNGNGQNDWVFEASLTLNSTKTIKSILETTNYRGSAAYTRRDLVDGINMYPVVVFLDGEKLNNAYDQTLGTYGPGTYPFRLFTYKEPSSSTVFSTFGVTIYFTDGTYITKTIPGSSVIQKPSITSLGTDNALSGEKVAMYISNFPKAYSYTVTFSGQTLSGDTDASLSSDGSYLGFMVPNFPSGPYKLTAQGRNSNDSLAFNTQNSVPFTIGTPSTQPSITVLSPNGGESFVQDTTLSGSFETLNIPYTSYCEIAIVGRKSDGTPVDATISYLKMIASDRQTFSGIIPSNIVPIGSYKIRVNCGQGASFAQDQSDSNFTITSPTTTKSTISNVLGAESFRFSQFLEQGSYGNEVMELQKFLSGAGYYVGNIDGNFGLKTKEAVIAFQAANKLKPDGIVGYEVRSLLNK